MTSAALRRPIRRHARGTVSVALVPLVFALLVMLVFGYDTSKLMLEVRAATEVAESAARAGAMELDVARLRSSGGRTVRIDQTRAASAARAYVNQRGHYRVDRITFPRSDTMRVEVSAQFEPIPIGLMPNRTVTGGGIAVGQYGVTSPDN